MSNKITFSELIDQISARSNKSKTFTDDFIRELVGIIETGLRKNGDVTIAGFGKFELRWINDRKGINPQTGEDITIPGHNKVVFKPYKSLRDHVNKPYLYMDSQILDESPEPDSSDDQINALPSEVPSTTLPTEDVPAAEAQENIEDLVFERPSPVQARNTPKRIHMTSLSEKRGLDIVSNVQEDSSFRWSYAAATLFVTMIILAVLYFMPLENQSTNQELSESTPTEVPSSTSQSPPLSSESIDVPDVPTPETPSTDVSGNTETSTSSDVIDSPLQSVSDTPVPENDLVMVESGQTLWDMAETHLSDPYLWPWIYHLNGDQITDPNSILSGDNITLPYVSNQGDLTEDNRMEVASGYLDVYMWYRNTDPENARYFLWAAGSYYEPILDQAAGSVNENDLAFARNQ